MVPNVQETAKGSPLTYPRNLSVNKLWLGLREFVVGDEDLAMFLAWMKPHLDERQRQRVPTGSVARVLLVWWHRAVAEVTEMSRSAVPLPFRTSRA